MGDHRADRARGRGALWWMLWGLPAGAGVVGNANVVGGIAGIATLVLALAMLRPWRLGRRDATTVATAEQLRAAAEYLAGETLRYWREQAHARRIVTPSPVSVRWQWAGEDVAVPAAQLRSDGVVLTAGVVTQLHEQLYDHLGDQARLVVLGEAGIGKTAAMLLLLIDVLEHRRPTDPVPVWLTLGSWDPRTTSLREWATATMIRNYPGLAATEHGGRQAATRLLDTGSVALFLDGLDELPPAMQGAALDAIDRHTGGIRVVLTSRPAQYRAALDRGRLYRAAVVELFDVAIDQAEAFLLAEQLEARRATWQHVVDQLRAHPNSVAARTLTTPLTLSLARDTYPSDSGAEDPNALLDTKAHPNPEAPGRHLLARFLHRAYPDQAEREHATRWLGWIAHHLGATRDLRWWDIPTWTPHWRLTHRLVTGLVGVLIIVLVGALMVALVGGQVGGLVAAVLGVLVAELTDAKRQTSSPRALDLRWPRGHEWRRLVGVLIGVLLVGLFGGLIRLEVVLEVGLEIVLVFGLVVGSVGALVFGLLEFWSTPLATSHAASPLKVYRTDRRRTVVFMLVVCLGVGLVFSLVVGLGVAPLLGLGVALLIGLLVGSLGGLGPATWLGLTQLGLAVRCRPVRFIPLLETALERQVLRQTGSVYQFRHAALQDYLADLHTAADRGRTLAPRT